MANTRIAGVGGYVPSRVVTNKDLEKLMDTSDEWIQQRSGIVERRWIEEGKDTTTSMATAACKEALEQANCDAKDVDAIIFGCLVSDYTFPGSGVLLQKELGCERTIPALDIRNQCAGFLYGLSVADAWIRTGFYKKVLLVGSEIHSTSMDITTRGRDISVLFGDGAGAMLLESTSEEGVIDTILHSEGKHAEVLAMVKPSSNDYPRVSPDTPPGESIFPYMDGRMVFKNAVTRMTEVMGEILERNKMSNEDLDFLVAHQANLRINQMVANQLKLPDNKTHNTLQKFGNTTMATIPLTFGDAIEENKVKRGDLVAFVAFGSGFVWGSSLLRY